MEVKEALLRFRQQKQNAKERGIAWKLTFHQWYEWWGDDLDRRGHHADELMMCRFHDKGAYELGNITKGYPRDNARTAGACKRNKHSAELAKKYQQTLDEADTDYHAPREELNEDELELARMFNPRRSNTWGKLAW